MKLTDKIYNKHINNPGWIQYLTWLTILTGTLFLLCLFAMGSRNIPIPLWFHFTFSFSLALFVSIPPLVLDRNRAKFLRYIKKLEVLRKQINSADSIEKLNDIYLEMMQTVAVPYTSALIHHYKDLELVWSAKNLQLVKKKYSF